MRPLRRLLLYLAVVFFGAALLSPWLYWFGQWAAGQHWTGFARLSVQPFHRYVVRSLLGLALIGMWPFLRSIGMSSWRAVGVVGPGGNWRRLGAGFGLGFVSLACVALPALLGGARTVKGDISTGALFSKLVSAGLTAVVVSTLEELLFRGAFFGALRKKHLWTSALVASSVIYALVHFFQNPPTPSRITWSSGLEVLPRMCRGFVDFEMLVPGFFTLLLVGIILGLAYQRTGNLYFSAGLHAGWIFWLKFYGAVTIPNAAASQWFWGTGKLVDGWLALGLLLPVLAVVWRVPKDSSSPAEAGLTAASSEERRSEDGTSYAA